MRFPVVLSILACVGSSLMFPSRSSASDAGDQAPPAPIKLIVSSSPLAYDARAGRHIYRRVAVPGAGSQYELISHGGEEERFGLKVKIAENTCDTVAGTCSLLLDIVAPAGSYKQSFTIQASSPSPEAASVSTSANTTTASAWQRELELELSLDPLSLRGLSTQELFDDQGTDGPTNFPLDDVRRCQDLRHLAPELASQCQAAFELLHDDEEPSTDEVCSLSESELERERCRGLLHGMQFNGCEGLTPIAGQTCQDFSQGVQRTCDATASDCHIYETMVHGYLNCLDHPVADVSFACVAWQNAHVAGIAPAWLQRFAAFESASTSVQADEDATADAQAAALAYIPQARIERLGLSRERINSLRRRYPSLLRSSLLNTPLVRPRHKADYWRSIEQSLDPSQTVGYELECLNLRLDITGGAMPQKTARYLRAGKNSMSAFSALLPPASRRRHLTPFDLGFKRAVTAQGESVTDYDNWQREESWPYLNTYRESLFSATKERMKMPLVEVTLESRYGVKHFPHVELITAPLTAESAPLSHKNASTYLASLMSKACEGGRGRSQGFISVQEWLDAANTLSLPSGERVTRYSKRETEDYLRGQRLFCSTMDLGQCHVQSNVAVFYDQFFTDVPLVQSLGTNLTYDSARVYTAAWRVTKRIFSILQWHHGADQTIDPRNHAAGIFTFTVYNLYLRALLYAGKFGFWKGTISQLMKTEPRKAWQRVLDDEEGPNGEASEQDLLRQAALMLWASPRLAPQLAAIGPEVIADFIEASEEGDTPDLPSGKKPRYTPEFAEKVHALFKELLWTIVLADDESYRKLRDQEWGHVLSEDTYKALFPDGERNPDEPVFIDFGDDEHLGLQYDGGSKIRPKTRLMDYQGQEILRAYSVIETREDAAPFNKAMFYRCGDEERPELFSDACS